MPRGLQFFLTSTFAKNINRMDYNSCEKYSLGKGHEIQQTTDLFFNFGISVVAKIM